METYGQNAICALEEDLETFLVEWKQNKTIPEGVRIGPLKPS